ncbi:uncharacterized protein Nmag_0371 [Natrialba magadii ATCC 43099]|uniref:Uncharacterized protein n=1 Tax=Natrialba magadii (strain ATCC 43099 / DSM 3394 / CCM 3739 / CIP 104546 / IAM 13178 / JCM 8861 / NBRC 102185 / NCIMB 2190 / MS3) TaxID=547559 RepID=D3SXS1_NATMM|nr:uncharacterized protein Nmag_0371 [Natrialba magadii ATCC 43099]
MHPLLQESLNRDPPEPCIDEDPPAVEFYDREEITMWVPDE